MFLSRVTLPCVIMIRLKLINAAVTSANIAEARAGINVHIDYTLQLSDWAWAPVCAGYPSAVGVKHPPSPNKS